MSMHDPGAGNFSLPPVDDVSPRNAGGKLAEQLAAVAKFNEAAQAAAPADEFPRFAYCRVSLPDKLQGWLDQLLKNMKKIVAHLPDVESYAVSVGLPAGISVTVTFTARTGGHPGS